MTEREAIAGSWPELKRTVFDSLMSLTGRAFVVVQYAPDVVIGRRGFLAEEQERGLVLVLNSSMPMSWEGDELVVRLVFGTTPEDCRIPAKRIVAIYNPDHQVQFVAPPGASEIETADSPNVPARVSDEPETGSEGPPGEEGKGRSATKGNVVEIDFNRGKKKS